MYKRRKQLRLPYFDYSQYGCYFVTICTKNREMIFGEIDEGEMVCNSFGCNLQDCLLSVLNEYPNSEIPAYVIMPNHLHFIWFNRDNVDLSIIVKKIKGRMTSIYHKYHKENNLIYTALWQRGFYEHIIRNDQDYQRISKYIIENPIKWHLDRFYIA